MMNKKALICMLASALMGAALEAADRGSTPGQQSSYPSTHKPRVLPRIWERFQQINYEPLHNPPKCPVCPFTAGGRIVRCHCDAPFGNSSLALARSRSRGRSRSAAANEERRWPDLILEQPCDSGDQIDSGHTGYETDRPPVSGLEPEWVSVAFSRVCSSVKIADFHFHDLRHTAASWMRMKGADIHTVALLLGHKDLRMALATSISPRRQPGCSPLPDLIGVCWARCPSFRRSPGFRAFLIRSRAGFADPRLRSATSRFKRPFSSRNCRSSRSSLIPNPAQRFFQA